MKEKEKADLIASKILDSNCTLRIFPREFYNQFDPL